jgi:transcriptional regulator with XRE-family HTH domain
MVTTNKRGPKGPLYVKEWRVYRGLSLEALGAKIELDGKTGVEKNTVWRWETDQKRLDPFKIAAIARALDLEPEDLWRPPPTRSIDGMIADQPDDVKATVADIVARLIKPAS